MAPPNTVLANINFTGLPYKDFAEETNQVEIENVRGKEKQYTLDQHGFQFFKKATTVTSFTDDQKIKKDYYPEAEQVFKGLTGASHVIIWDHKRTADLGVQLFVSAAQQASSKPRPEDSSLFPSPTSTKPPTPPSPASTATPPPLNSQTS
ncbi:hypothetical protein BDV98DRAFT_656206 [Pterulicium gracile]|uniref:Uncharacterized protein n=1 Tax=Pterulicium gracile TaxID=1884261 RepID=A0A5C3QIL0_9AGAR|nr:hypothetical protein BDV98DRAFT_656206 [Pterula gracilis]